MPIESAPRYRLLHPLPQPLSALPAEVLVPDPAWSHYLGHVLRLTPGLPLTVVDPDTRQAYAARVVALDASGVRLMLNETWGTAGLPAFPNVALAVAMVKAPRWEVLLQKSTELGVGHLWPLLTDRTIVRPDDGEAKRRRWQSILEHAAQQAEGWTVPKLRAPQTVASVIAAAQDVPHRWLLLERAEARWPLNQAIARMDWTPETAQPVDVVAVIGPEGGWTDAEVATFRAAGFEAVSLGTRILKTETAALATMAVIAAAFDPATPDGLPSELPPG